MSMKQHYIIKALMSLCTGQHWEVPQGTTEYSGIIWVTDTPTPPTQSEVEAEATRLEAEENLLQVAFDQNQYQRDRAKEYPLIADQLDMIYHAGLGGEVFQSTIQAVKDKYPKPE